jgi:tRNA pseudouridine(55) synthase
MLITIKPPGCTINQYIEKFKQENDIKKLCFCGRLDPMARGKLLLLTNNECKYMNLYLNNPKTYEFEIVFGIQTDTDDPLGILESIDIINPNSTPLLLSNIYEKLIQQINHYNCTNFNQKFHHYSSKKIKGLPLWYYKKNNIAVERPEHSVEISSISINQLVQYDFTDWKNNIIEQINSIDKTKDFNQTIIIKQWENLNLHNIYTLPISIHVSSGFYIRQFVRDLSDIIQYPLMAYDINRTNIIL